MKKLFRKAVSVLGSVALVGATISTAAAATYPSPFADGDYAVVYGAAADAAAANTLASGLPSLGGSTTTVSGGESFTLQKTSDKFNLGDQMTDFATSLDEDDMPVFLADGVYKDSARTEYDYNQRINTKGTQLTWFKDSDYNDKEPTLGFHYASGADVLDYVITFEDGGITNTTLEQTTLPLMGNGYFVLEADDTLNKLVLLDSSATTIISEGQPVTVNVGGVDYTVEALIEESWVKYTVNGETTDKLEDGDSFELEDGAVLASIENLYTSKDTGVSKAEFTIGSGKLTLQSGNEVEINDDPVSGVTATLSFAGVLTSITIDWNTDEEVFVTDENPEVVLPGFNTMKVIYGGLNEPEATEEVTFDAGSTATLTVEVEEGTLTLPLAWTDEDGVPYLGEQDEELVVNSTAKSTTGYNFSEGQRFVVSYISSDKEEYKTYAYEVQNVANATGNAATVTLNSLVTGGSDIELDFIDSNGYEKDEILFNVTNAADYSSAEDWAVINISAAQGSTASVYVNRIYSVGGYEITLPESSTFYENSTTGGANGDTLNATSFTVTVEEVDEDAKADNGGGILTLTMSVDSTEDAIDVSTVTPTGSSGTDYGLQETLTDDIYVGYFYTPVGSMWQHDRSADLYELVLTSPMEETMATVQIASGTASVSSTSGQKTFMDSESGYAGKNLVVVGGSCVNSVAARLVGGAHCGDAFAAATGVGPSKFLIQSFSDGGKTATLVAGYEAADTTVAANYLNNEGNAVMTDVGVKYIGETSTESAVKVS